MIKDSNEPFLEQLKKKRDAKKKKRSFAMINKERTFPKHWHDDANTLLR